MAIGYSLAQDNKYYAVGNKIGFEDCEHRNNGTVILHEKASRDGTKCIIEDKGNNYEQTFLSADGKEAIVYLRQSKNDSPLLVEPTKDNKPHGKRIEYDKHARETYSCTFVEGKKEGIETKTTYEPDGRSGTAGKILKTKTAVYKDDVKQNFLNKLGKKFAYEKIVESAKKIITHPTTKKIAIATAVGGAALATAGLALGLGPVAAGALGLGAAGATNKDVRDAAYDSYVKERPKGIFGTGIGKKLPIFTKAQRDRRQEITLDRLTNENVVKTSQAANAALDRTINPNGSNLAVEKKGSFKTKLLILALVATTIGGFYNGLVKDKENKSPKGLKVFVSNHDQTANPNILDTVYVEQGATKAFVTGTLSDNTSEIRNDKNALAINMGTRTMGSIKKIEADDKRGGFERVLDFFKSSFDGYRDDANGKTYTAQREVVSFEGSDIAWNHDEGDMLKQGIIYYIEPTNKEGVVALRAILRETVRDITSYGEDEWSGALQHGVDPRKPVEMTDSHIYPTNVTKPPTFSKPNITK